MKKFYLLAIALLFIFLSGCATHEVQGEVVYLKSSVGQSALGSWIGSDGVLITALVIRDSENNLHFFATPGHLNSVEVNDIVKISYDNDIACSSDQRTTVYDENEQVVTMKVIDYLKIKEVQIIKKSASRRFKAFGFFFSKHNTALNKIVFLHPS